MIWGAMTLVMIVCGAMLMTDAPQQKQCGQWRGGK
jgi:OFA family oxalate/formate antiporter-like MFS transporter